MKLNKKGFMMAEVIVVSAIILTFLAGIFISYNKIYSTYKTRLDYYDVTALYRVRYHVDYNQTYITKSCYNHSGTMTLHNCKLLQAKDVSGPMLLPELKNSNLSYENVQEKVFMIYNNYKNLPSDIMDKAVTNKGEAVTVNLTFKEYANYLATSADFTNTNYVMILERCQTNNSDDCKYAYLEVLDEE